MIISVGFEIVNANIVSQDSKDYSIYSGGILGSLEYDRTEKDYYIIKERGLFTLTEIAIPAENVDISFFTDIYKPVYVYCSKGTNLYDSQITINSENYELCDTAVKIKPDFLDLILIIGIVDFFVIALFNSVLLIINIGSLYGKEHSDSSLK